MTREEALKLALSSTTSIPEAIKQAEDIMAYLSGENPSIGSTWALDTAMVAGESLQTKQHPLPQKTPELDLEISTLLGKASKSLRWSKESDNVLIKWISSGSKTALFDAAVDLQCSVKACYVRMTRMEQFKSMTRNQSALLLHGAREALMEYCGETGSMR